MKVLFINTTDITGGAAVILQRLMSGLRAKYDVQTKLIVRNKKGDADDTSEILQDPFQIITEKILDRVTRRIGYLYMTFPFSSSSILKITKSFKPDIINVHNTHGGYFAVPLFEQISEYAPVIWTLHDMWSFTGNSSHTFGNTSWMQMNNDKHLTRVPPTIGINTGSYLLKRKRKTYRNSDLTIVTPSLWLKNLADQSPVFEGKNIHHIPNGIDLLKYKPANKASAREKLGLPANERIIIFSSHILDKTNPWKGGMDLLEILRRINSQSKQKINLLILGEGDFRELDEFSNFRVFRLGYVKEENTMINCLVASDLFLYPTRADNLPNVLVESVACGTPCITFDVGGNKEIVHHDFNGLLVTPFDFDSFAEETIRLLQDEAKLALFSKNCSSIKPIFDLNYMIDNYYSVFVKQIKPKL